MKFLYKLCLLLVFIISAVYPQDKIGDIIQGVKSDSLMKYVRELSGEIPVAVDGDTVSIISRHFNRPGNLYAMKYLKQKLDLYGIDTRIQQFSETGQNILGVKKGTKYPEKYYIIGAHFDSEPHYQIAPGADDNASGCAAVLEAARLLSSYEFPYTIVFAFWDEEEHKFLGSIHFADSVLAAGDSIMGVINYDMIAYDSDGDCKMEVHSMDIGKSRQHAEKFIELNSAYDIGLTILHKNPGKRSSDQRSFWDRNFSAVYFKETDLDFNPNYHTEQDVADSLNPLIFKDITQASLALLAYLAWDDVIPVELASFTGSYNGAVNLYWTTASETNNKGFSVERKSAQSSWQSIGYVPGKGTSAELNSYSFTDKSVSKGLYFYRLRQEDYDGTYKYYGQVEVNAVTDFKLSIANYPNPFNPVTHIKYSVPQKGTVKINIYTVTGEKVAALLNEEKEAGEYTLDFNAARLSGGVYISTIETGGNRQTSRMVLLK